MTLNKIFGIFGIFGIVACDNPMRDDGKTVVSVTQNPTKVIRVLDSWKTMTFGCNAEDQKLGKCEYYSLYLSNEWTVIVPKFVFNRCQIGTIYPACNSIPDSSENIQKDTIGLNQY